jgi:hypothetical protein
MGERISTQRRRILESSGPRQGPFGSPSEVEPPSAVGVVGVGDFRDLALVEVQLGGAKRRPARSARRFSNIMWSKP